MTPFLRTAFLRSFQRSFLRSRAAWLPPAALAAVLAVPAAPVHAAADYATVGSLTQDEFRFVARDLAQALSWKGIIPAESLGVLGFDVGVGLNVTGLNHADLMRRASGGSGPSTFWTPSLRVHKGLPMGLDVGGTYGRVLGTDLGVWSLEGRYAVVRGNPLVPAVAVRVATAGLTGAQGVGMQSTSAELSVSKGFGIFTPYAGIGHVWTRAWVRDAPSLHGESLSMGRYYVGLDANLGWNFAVELGRTGSSTTLGLKTGMRFASWF